MVESREWIDHTYQVLESLHHISASLNDTDTGRRGYILTDESDYLETYEAGVRATKDAIETTRNLTKDNVIQQRHLTELETVINQQLALFQQSIKLIQQRKLNLEAQRDLSKKGVTLQQGIRAKLNLMDNVEKTLLQQRSVATDKSIQTTFALISTGYCLSFGLLISVYCLLQKQIRDRKKAELALRQANEQLEIQIRERTEANTALQKEVTRRLGAQQKLEKLAVTLKRSNQDLEQFAYVASHDLQEPLRTVTSYTQMLERRYQGNLDEKADKYIHYIVDGASRMQQLINDLLAYSRIGRKRSEFKLTDCNNVLAMALRNLQEAIADSKGTVTHDPLPTVMADAGQLVQLFQNLVGNALKYQGDSPPQVHVSTVQRTEEWMFSVQDNGIGIDPQYAERIFILFQRLHTRRNYSGTGIGLAICKKIIESHKGSIWVESQPGEGSTFFFTIPFSPDEDQLSDLDKLTSLEVSV